MGVIGFAHFFRKCIEQKHIKNYTGSTMIVDAIFQIFRYSVGIRNSGSDIINGDGKRLNHIWAIMQYTLYLWRLGIKPIFVFDGKPPAIKKEALRARKLAREKAAKILNDIGEDSSDYVKYFKRTFTLTGQEIKDCIELLEYLGIPYVREDGEADLYCAPLMKQGNITGVITNDTDLLVFGTDKILKNFSGNKLVEEISLHNVYSHIVTKINDINMRHNIPIVEGLDKSILRNILIDLSILLGCDYTPHLKGIRIDQVFENYVLNEFDIYKTVDHIKKYTDVPDNFAERIEDAKKYYLQSDSIDLSSSNVKHNEPNKEKIYDFLHKKNNMSESHTNNFLREIDKFFYKKKTFSKDDSGNVYINNKRNTNITHNIKYMYTSNTDNGKNVYTRGKYHVNKNRFKKEENRTINKFAVLGDN